MRALIFALEVGVENQIGVGGTIEPAVLLDFGFELTRGPAGIAESENRPVRAVAGGDRPQNVDRMGQ